jgi:hypothetical protein
MKIRIKTQDIEIEYSDDMSEIREQAVKNIKIIVETIFLESIRKENNPIPSQVIRSYPNGTGPTFFNACPDIN